MKKKKIHFFYIVIYTFIILLLLIMTGCSNYRQLIFNNAFYNCYFEYPISHHVISIDEGNNESSIASVFIALVQTKAPQDEYIIVNVMKIDSLFPSYGALLEYNLNSAQQGQNEYEFILVDRSIITIDSVSGEKIVYSYFRHPQPIIENDQIIKPEAIPAISYSAYFENKGF